MSATLMEGFGPQELPQRTPSFEDCISLAASEVSWRPLAFLLDWDTVRFVYQRCLPQATRSGCPIEVYVDRLTGLLVTAKRFPREQAGGRLQAMQEGLQEGGPCGLEAAWPELVLTQRLGRQGLAGVCTCFGAFHDNRGDVLLVTEFIPGGDLFDLAIRLGKAGPEREKLALPVIRSLLDAVLRLHSCGVAHCDVSLENALRRADGEVVLIDFETSVTGSACRRTGVRGKPSYQAPEMYSSESWDAFAADLFACGVSAYCLALGTYPWKSTKPGVCRRFAFYQRFGFRTFLRKRGVAESPSAWRPGDGYLSPALAELLEVLLHPDPTTRCKAMESLCRRQVPLAAGGSLPAAGVCSRA